jgi:hypothetical protein
MSVALYLDEHVPRSIAIGLRLRGVDVLTAIEDKHQRTPDAVILDRASALGRVLFSQDVDLLIEAKQRQEVGRPFAGVIYAHPLHVTIGLCINDLELIAQVAQPQELVSAVLFLPLQ